MNCRRKENISCQSGFVGLTGSKPTRRLQRSSKSAANGLGSSARSLGNPKWVVLAVLGRKATDDASRKSEQTEGKNRSALADCRSRCLRQARSSRGAIALRHLQAVQRIGHPLCQQNRRNSNSSWRFAPISRGKPKGNVPRNLWRESSLVSRPEDIASETSATFNITEPLDRFPIHAISTL